MIGSAPNPSFIYANEDQSSKGAPWRLILFVVSLFICTSFRAYPFFLFFKSCNRRLGFTTHLSKKPNAACCLPVVNGGIEGYSWLKGDWEPSLGPTVIIIHHPVSPMSKEKRKVGLVVGGGKRYTD